MKISAIRLAYDRNAVRARAVMTIADATREFSQLFRCGDFDEGEISRLDNYIVVAETMKLNELWRQ
jgi:hypothetical protein